MNSKLKAVLLRTMKKSFNALNSILLISSLIISACTNIEHEQGMYSGNNDTVKTELMHHLGNNCKCTGLVLSAKKHTDGLTRALANAHKYTENNPRITRLDLVIYKSRFYIVLRGDNVSGAICWSKKEDLVKPYLGDGDDISNQWKALAYSLYRNQPMEIPKGSTTIHAGDNNIPKTKGDPQCL